MFDTRIAILGLLLLALSLTPAPVSAQGSHGSLRSKPTQPAAGNGAAASSNQKQEPAIECTTPHMVPELHAPEPQAPAVLETVKAMAKAAARGDAEKYKTCLDDGCTIFDEANNTMLTGKQAAVANMMKEFDRDKNNGKHISVSIKIDQPFIKVAGNSAVVSYHSEKTIALDGAPPLVKEAFFTQVFVKEGNNWKLSSHTSGRWSEKKAN